MAKIPKILRLGRVTERDVDEKGEPFVAVEWIDSCGDLVEGIFGLVAWNVAPQDVIRQAYAAMAGGPVAMTSVTRPSNATPPPQGAATVPKKKDRPPRR